MLYKFTAGVSVILLARLVDINDFSTFSTVTAFSNVAIIFISFGVIDNVLVKASSAVNASERLLIYNQAAKGMLYISVLIVPLFLFLSVKYSDAGIYLSLVILLKLVAEQYCIPVYLTEDRINLDNRFLGAVYVALTLQNTIAVVLVYCFKSVEIFVQFQLISMCVALICIYGRRARAGKAKVESRNGRVGLLVSEWLNDKRTAYPYFVSHFMGYAFLQSGVLFLSLFGGKNDVAMYAAGFNLFLAGLIAPAITYNYYLPQLRKLYLSGHFHGFLSVLVQMTGLVLVYSLFVSLPFLLVPGAFVSLLYGESFSAVAAILPFIGAVLFMHSLCFVFGAILTSNDRQKERARIQMLVGVTYVGSLIYFQIEDYVSLAKWLFNFELALFLAYLFQSGKTIFLWRYHQ